MDTFIKTKNKQKHNYIVSVFNISLFNIEKSLMDIVLNTFHEGFFSVNTVTNSSIISTSRNFLFSKIINPPKFLEDIYKRLHPRMK